MKLFMRALLVAAVAVTGLMTAPVAPAAAANCVADSVDYNELWYSGMSVVLYRTASCGYYSKLTIDHGPSTCCSTLSWKVERQVATPYGFVLSTTDTRERSVLGGSAGNWNTGTAPGFGYSTAALEQDKHRTCWRVNSGSWTCGSWAAV